MIPGSANPLLLVQQDTGYKVQRSLRFNSSDSAYLSRTPASAGNRKTWTWAGWVKRSALQSGTSNTYMQVFSAGTSGTARDVLFFDTDTDDTLAFYSANGIAGAATLMFRTNAVFRDASAWMHIVLAVDTTQATAANRVKLYVNGTEQTFSTVNYPSQNAEGYINQNNAHYLATHPNLNEYFSGYLADIHFIDGQALTPSSFTEVSATTGQLVPKAYSGSFGTNGFWLKFSDNSAATATTLGKDYSSNGNNWTPNNLSVTAGAGNDSLVDTPTSYGTDTGAGNEVRGNYCTWNPLDNGSVTLSNGNLDGSATVAWKNVRGTIAFPSSGKWYYEVTPGGSALLGVGIAAANKNLTDQSTGTFVTYNEDGRFYKDGSINASGKATYTSGDVIGVAFDCDTNSVTFYKNNVSQGSVTPTTGVFYFPFVQIYNSSLSANWGSRAFAYTAPSGFKALVDTNLTAPVIAKPSTVMDVLLWSGTGGNRSFSSLNMSPDFVWIKQRNQAYSVGHQLYDIVRGAGSLKQLDSSNTTAEGGGNTNQYGYLSSFDSTGFSVTVGSIDSDYVNKSGVTYVAWAWDAGSSTVTNTQGSITSSVRVNATSGCAVVSYTGNGTSGATVGHSLGISPGLLIVKNRDEAQNWYVSHSSLATGGTLILNNTDATYAAGTLNRGYVSAMSSTTFTLTAGANGTSDFKNVNQNTQKYIVYAFSPVAGYSSFGSYTGNGSTDGPFVYTGFRPRFLLIKVYSGDTGAWRIYDSSRNTYNVVDLELNPNLSGAEYTASNTVDFTSNGFKIRTSSINVNLNTAGFIYAAFAENPFQYARAR